MSLYEMKTRTLEGQPVDLSTYRGKVALVVNTASECGYTPQYDGLEKLYEELKGEGLVVLGFGVPPKPDFWVAEGKPSEPRIHIAFHAENRKLVDEFYRAALAAGGRDNGPPGPRPHYHENYYGAFVLDPDGHNIEAVCHTSGG